MPWRGETDLYKIWLSEVMLQQTQVKTVIPYYKRWIKRFPDTKSVAMATEDQVLKLWEGLGYYSRARNFKSACEWIYYENNNKIPLNSDKFLGLKGVGEYIHAAVRSIALNEVIPVVDGNVKRVVSRLIELKTTPTKGLSKIKTFLNSVISSKFPGDFNQAMMDLGSTICKPRNPMCNTCCISRFCLANEHNSVNNFPLLDKKQKIPHKKIAVGVIWKNNKILISKRKPNVMLGGLWEFPGGKIKKNETAEDCTIREIKEELNVGVSITEKITTIKHTYSHFTIELTAFHCQFDYGTPKAIGCSDFRWISPAEFDSFAFPKANHKIFNQIPGKNPCTSYNQ